MVELVQIQYIFCSMGEILILPLFVKRLVVRAGRMDIWCGGSGRVYWNAHMLLAQ